ncbi:hypothetical protein N7535_002176 [Penicillium sp. DV-2018c]|nr:hypothetical protein N7461_004580 [Penicillium sp. DV-2018c]KAJ5583556.1 hypothetical protein N7535_002176 [Penicillium sp. DV-2018c]
MQLHLVQVHVRCLFIPFAEAGKGPSDFFGQVMRDVLIGHGDCRFLVGDKEVRILSLGFSGLNGTLRPRGWWPIVRADTEETMRTCPSCQVAQGAHKSLEREAGQYMVTPGLRTIERWGIDLIGRLPTTANGNRWIVTAIDYETGWPVARAVPDATEEVLAEFLYKNVYAHYGTFNELISDNGPNVLSGAVRHSVNLIKARHRTTTPYHLRTNGNESSI